MSEDTRSTKLQLSEDAETHVQKIATDVDFKPYLDMVNADSQRTRTVIIVLVAALLLIFTAYRNTTFPDWTDSRLSRLQHAALCVENKLNSNECEISKAYAKEFLIQSAYGAGLQDQQTEKELSLELREQINAFIRQRTDALSLRLPFFGIVMDMNDLGMVCGLLLIAILFVLYASLRSETADLEIAKAKTLEMDEKKRADSHKLLLMAQVLASPSKSRIGVGKGLYILFALVPLVHLLVVWSDAESYGTARKLEGPGWAKFETGVDVAAFFVVLACTILCVLQQRRLNCGLDTLIPSGSKSLTEGNKPAQLKPAAAP